MSPCLRHLTVSPYLRLLAYSATLSLSCHTMSPCLRHLSHNVTSCDMVSRCLTLVDEPATGLSESRSTDRKSVFARRKCLVQLPSGRYTAGNSAPAARSRSSYRDVVNRMSSFHQPAFLTQSESECRSWEHIPLPILSYLTAWLIWDSVIKKVDIVS